MKKIFTFEPSMKRAMTANSKPPTCCFCCHVKAGTIIYSLLYLVVALIGIVFASLALTGVVTVEDSSSMQTGILSYNSDLTPEQVMWVMLVNGMFFLLISTSAIYGVVKNRAGFILPMFIVQLFDFLCTMVSVGSVVFYWPAFKQRILSCPHMSESWKETLENMDERWLACIVFLTLALVILVKAYLISMVYRCYKHITTQVILRQRRQTEINYVSTDQEKPLSARIYMPPRYEDIQKVPLVDDAEDMDVKPPPYDMA